MFKTKLSLLLVAIFLLNIDVLLLSQAFAEEAYKGSKEKSQIISRFNSKGNFSRATDPDCGQFRTGAALAGIAILVGALWTGIVVLVSSIGLFTAVVIVGMIAATVGVWKAIGGLVVCQHSFVRHPVMRDEKGNYNTFELSERASAYKDKLDKTYETEDDYFKKLGSNSIEQGKKIAKDLFNLNQPQPQPNKYCWPKNAVEYSDYIEICNREHLAFDLSKLMKGSEEIKGGFDIREKELGNPGEGWLPQVDGDLECKTLKAGEYADIHGSKFKAVKRSSRLCVELDSVSWLNINMTPWPSGVDIGCTYLPPDPGAPMCKYSVMEFKNNDGTISRASISNEGDYKNLIFDQKKEGKTFEGYDNSKCFPDYISKSCYSDAGSKSLVPIPITSMVVQCIKESLDNLVIGQGPLRRKTFLSNAQETLRNTVTAVLVLALVLFSIKVMSGGVRNPPEMYMLILKFALVMYFTAGNGMSTYSRYLVDISNGLSDIVLKASSESKGICNYDVNDYIYTNGAKEERHNYLAPWDKLDCRMLFYFGAPLSGVPGKVATGGIALVVTLLGAAPILLVAGSVIGIIFAGGQVLVALLAILMAVMMIMIILWATYTFILSFIALNVLIILSPLFIPMVLFQHTKGYFDGWIRELITYSLYPVLLFAFLSFMFIACDKIFFKGLTFDKKTLPVLDQKKVWFEIKDNMCNNHPNTLACMLQKHSWKKSSILGLFDFTYLEFENSVLGEVLKLSLILFLFYYFLGILPSIIAELAGNPRAALGSGETPKNMMGKALSTAKSGLGGMGGMATSAFRSMSGKSSDSKGNSGEGEGKSSESLSKGNDS